MTPIIAHNLLAEDSASGVRRSSPHSGHKGSTALFSLLLFGGCGVWRYMALLSNPQQEVREGILIAMASMIHMTFLDSIPISPLHPAVSGSCSRCRQVSRITHRMVNGAELSPTNPNFKKQEF